jgi:CHAD domain-containing protein
VQTEADAGASPAPDTPPQISVDPETSVINAAAQALETGLALLKFYETAAIQGEIEGIHQFRVSVRRLRAAIELFAPVLHGSRLRFYRAEVPHAGHCAGTARDADVLIELLRAHSAALDAATARALTPVYQTLADTRIAAMRELTGFLQSKRYAQLCARLTPTLTRRFAPAVTLRQLAPKLIEAIARGGLRAGARLKPQSPPRTFHRLRVRLKRVRYALEILDRLAGKRASKALKRLRRMQDELGEHQDLVNTAAWLRQFAQTQRQPEILLAAGALLQFVSERRVKVAARAFLRWKKLERSGILTDAVKEISELAQASGKTSEAPAS